jgi:PKD repeat protein
LTANFTDVSSDSDGTIVSRSWNFGDGRVSTATNPSHTYATKGSYPVTLTVTDNDGASDSVSIVVKVVSNSNKAPTARFNYRASGLKADFTDVSSDSDGTIVSRSWNFGDGRVSTATNPGHTYSSPGNYTVRLTVTDDKGQIGIFNKNVTAIGSKKRGGIVYIYCYLYGCNTDQTVAAASTVDRATPVALNTADASSSTNTYGRGQSPIADFHAQDTSGHLSNATWKTIVATALPSLRAPSDLTVSVSENTATLHWADNSSNELEFVIERCEETGNGNNQTCNFVEWVKVPANTTSYKGIPVNGTYSYRVKANNRIQDSTHSKEVKI